LGKFQQPQSYLVIETASFKLGYNWNHLGKLEEFHSDLHILYLGKLQQPN